MKAGNHLLAEITHWVASASKRMLMALIGMVAIAISSQAQSLPLSHGERIDYDLYFKWGLIMSRAGLATLSVQDDLHEGVPAWKYNLLFRSAGVIEKIFSMRDTMDCYYSKEHQLLFGSKRTNEGNYYQVDELRFNYGDNEQVRVHSLRYTRTRTKIDTTLVGDKPIFDMLGATMHLRAIDWRQIEYGKEFPFTIAIGRDLVKARFRYTGQQIVERKEAKYRTRHFYIDIYDEAFTQAKEAAEVWIGDDENHIPVKIRAKLKLGAAEVYFKNGYNLRAPLDCRIILSQIDD